MAVVRMLGEILLRDSESLLRVVQLENADFGQDDPRVRFPSFPQLTAHAARNIVAVEPPRAVEEPAALSKLKTPGR